MIHPCLVFSLAIRASNVLHYNTWGRPKSELIREALQRQLALTRFEDLRQRTAPFAEARGWLTDEDVFRELS
jgi:hypothetical protein